MSDKYVYILHPIVSFEVKKTDASHSQLDIVNSVDEEKQNFLLHPEPSDK